VDSLRQALGVVRAGEHTFSLVSHDDRGSGVLAARQHPAGTDIGVLEKLQGDKRVVFGGFRVVQDSAELRQVGGAVKKRDVFHRLGGQHRQCLWLDLQDFVTIPDGGCDVARSQLPVLGGIGFEVEHLLVAEFGHGLASSRREQRTGAGRWISYPFPARHRDLNTRREV
jgi:hypothetical protein